MAAEVTAEWVGPVHISVVTREPGKLVARRDVMPGIWVDDVWIDTDIGKEADDVKALAAKVWTAEAVALYKSATRSSATPEQQRRATFSGQPDVKDIKARLSSATPAQIDAYVDANVTTIAQTRTMFKAMLKLIALDGRS